MGAALFRVAGNLVSPRGGRGRLCILIYHRALAAHDPILHDEIDAATLECHMAFLAAEFNVLPLGEACTHLARGSLPPRAACITFDDGYADNEQVALPMLKRHGLQATFFVSTAYSDGGIMFNDAVIEAVRVAPAGLHDLSRFGVGTRYLSDSASRRAAIDALLRKLKYLPVAERAARAGQVAEALGATLPRNLMMRPAQIRRLHDEGMEIGAHTVNHPLLAMVGMEEAREEITGSKRRLEEITGSSVTLFAYPNGKPGQDYGPEHIQLVKEAGYAAAVSTVAGAAHRGSDPFQLPRFTPWDRDGLRFGLRLLSKCVRPAPG